eukprot:m.43202 g.43202  ORF g.43202 m.43202 type:complete len:471 (+) comp8401_c0_seq2:122-1534(+)
MWRSVWRPLLARRAFLALCHRHGAVVKFHCTSSAPQAPRERAVVLGSGWAGFRVAKDLAAAGTLDVTVVSPVNHFLFTPLLPSTAVGTLEFRAIQEPVRTIPNVHYHQAKARDLDLASGILHCEDIFKYHTFQVPFDKLVIATGVKTNTFKTPGILERENQEVFFLKHLYHARGIRSRVLECFERADVPGVSVAERNRLLSFVVVGGGPTSCEFTAELHDFIVEDVARWYPDLRPSVTVTLVEASDHLLGSFDSALRGYVDSLFKRSGINVVTGVSVKAVENDEPKDFNSIRTTAILSDGSKIPFGCLVWSAGLSPVKFVESLPFERGPTGRILVDAKLQVLGYEERIWALGDCAANQDKPLAALAQVAEQQARYVARDVIGGHRSNNKPFELFLLGSMTQLGWGKGVVDMTHVGNPHGNEIGLGTISGPLAFIMWRGVYFTRQLSIRNMLLIPMHWFKTMLFGRDISRF